VVVFCVVIELVSVISWACVEEAVWDVTSERHRGFLWHLILVLIVGGKFWALRGVLYWVQVKLLVSVQR